MTGNVISLHPVKVKRAVLGNAAAYLEFAFEDPFEMNPSEGEVPPELAAWAAAIAKTAEQASVEYETWSASQAERAYPLHE